MASSERKLGAVTGVACSATAACWAELMTLPLDTAKVRLQVQRTGAGEVPKYSGLLSTMFAVGKEEGFATLWKGLVPGCHRHCVFGGLRIGLYPPVKDLYEPMISGLPLKLAAALTTGVLGITAANPTDLVKVRLQSQGKSLSPPKYPSAVKAYGIIAKEEGIAGLWTGWSANVGRSGVMSMVEVAGYDVFKETLSGLGVNGSLVLPAGAGTCAGFAAACVGTPVDVLKSRIMGDKTGQFTGFLDCAVKTLREGGPVAFYKGFIPHFARVGSFNCIVFLTLEQIKTLYFQHM
eukprot:CAMPEP_0117512810 /NCGR_PEP_ID=MMETSP0784-20121206/29225_1 /TAXON_ID=39447 /ORGANISM="" /LENGTH=291 /DNA_ID=CAMNT_0005308545 /DNA_START=52 /DNA_END=927 /DNA_ORIENTATION=-